MDIKKLETLKIHSLTEEQYQKAKEEGTLEETAIYLTPDDGSSEPGASSEELEQLQSQVDALSETVTANKTSTDGSIRALEESNESLSQELSDTAGALEEKITKNTTDITTTNQSLEELDTEVETVKGDLSSHATSSNAQFGLVREEFAAQDTENLKTAKEYSDANKEAAVSSAKDYTDQKINELVNGTGLENVVDTIKDINEAMAESSDMMEALETANSKKVDKGAKGSTIKPIYFDDNGAQEIAYTIEKSVPADAKFTDTTYTLIKDSTNKKILLMNGDKQVSEVDDNNTTYTIDGSLSTSSTNPIQNKVVAEGINNLQEDIDANASEIEEINSKDLFETKHVEGNAIAVSDSAEAPFVGMKLYGKTTQDGTPTPDAPVPLVSVGDSGSFDVGVYGKNLIPYPYYETTKTYGGITWTDNGDGTITANGTATENSSFVLHSYSMFLAKGTYTISGVPANAGYSTYMIQTATDEGFAFNNTIATGETFTLDKDTKTMIVAVVVWKGCTVNNLVFKPQIELGTVATPYEKGNKQTLTIPYTLRSVGDVKDEVDFNRGVLIQRCGEITFNGSENWTKNAWEQFCNNPMINWVRGVGICSHFVNKEGGNPGVFISGSMQNINFYDTSFNGDISAFKTWLSNNKPTVIYQLATPTEIPLTETELNAYRQLHTNKPNTTILSEAEMEVDYVVDSTSAEYIENRLDTLKSGINNALEDKLSFDEEVVNSTSDVSKVVPEGSGKYAAVNKVGGMSYRAKNRLEVTATTRTVSGVTFTVNADKSVTISGTATDRISFGLTSVIPNIYKGYVLSGCPNGSNSTYCLFVDYFNDSGWTSSQYVYNTEATLNSGERSCIFYLLINKGVTVNTTIYPMLREATETNTSYEPYYSGLRNAYVSEIKSVGKNFLETTLASQSINGAVITNNGDGTYNVNGTFTDYTMLYFNESLQNYLIKGKTFKSVGTVGFQIIKTDGAVSYSDTVTYDDSISQILVYKAIGGGETFSNVKLSPMVLLESETDYTFEPYKAIEPFTIPTGARGVGYGMGVNEDCYNYIDFERKVYRQNCAKITLNGSEDWTPNGNKQEYAFVIDNIGGESTGGELANVISDKLNTEKHTEMYSGNVKNAIATVGGNIHKVYIRIDETVNTTELLKQWLAANPVTVIYELATPIETDISDYIQDNFIEVAAGGVITAVNEYNYNVPTEYEFYTSENPEKVIVADKFVGDLIGTANKAKTIEGVTGNISTHIEQYWEWTEADEEGTEAVTIQPPEEGYNRCEICTYEKQNFTGDYVSIGAAFLPYKLTDNSAVIQMCSNLGETIASAKLGKQNGYQGTVWGIGTYMKMSISKKTMTLEWNAFATDLETNSTSVTQSYENFAKGVNQYILESGYSSSTPDDFFTGGIVPLLMYAMNKKVGNYVKAIWYKD